MAGLYSHTTRASGSTLTAAIYNADHQNHVNNHELDQMNDHSDSTAEMRTQTDPYPSASISQATHAAGELERIRYQLDLIIGKTYWYEDPVGSIQEIGSEGSLIIKARMFT